MTFFLLQLNRNINLAFLIKHVLKQLGYYISILVILFTARLLQFELLSLTHRPSTSILSFPPFFLTRANKLKVTWHCLAKGCDCARGLKTLCWGANVLHMGPAVTNHKPQPILQTTVGLFHCITQPYNGGWNGTTTTVSNYYIWNMFFRFLALLGVNYSPNRAYNLTCTVHSKTFRPLFFFSGGLPGISVPFLHFTIKPTW